MNLTKTINEDASGGAVGAGAVGGYSMPLFSSLVKRNAVKIKPVTKNVKKRGLGLKEAYASLIEDLNPDSVGGTSAPGTDFDASGVIAKLKSLENREKSDNRDTITFGLEDDDGGLVRVIVKSEEAEDFERALQSFLVDREQEEQDIPEIAEILFKLKDQFSIVDVQWPEVQEDEEQETELQGNEGEMDIEGDNAMDLEAGSTGADTSQVGDLLTQVIDMMKADADARKAEARAREAEAKTKEADAIVNQSMSRVKQEEQYLDMETHERAQKEQDKEAKRLAKLAKWKHQLAQDQGIEDEPSVELETRPKLGSSSAVPEEEEQTMSGPPRSKLRPVKKGAGIRGRVHPHDIASYILNRVK